MEKEVNGSLFVENVMLTRAYYKEYLRFEPLQNGNGTDAEHLAKMKFGENIIVLRQLNTRENDAVDFSNVVIEIKTPIIEELFHTYRKKVKINSPLHFSVKGYKEFSILDCNGNRIKFRNERGN